MKLTSQILSATSIDADILTGKNQTEVDLTPSDANPPAGGDRDVAIVERVLQEAAGHGGADAVIDKIKTATLPATDRNPSRRTDEQGSHH